jgi:hypothetical protein
LHESASPPASHAFDRKRLVRLILPGAAVVLLLLPLGLYRLTRTAEYAAAFGSDRQRQDICRVLPGLAAWRRRRILRRLLDDRCEGVQIAALTAAGMGGEDPVLDDRIERTLRDPATPVDVRVRAGEVLLGRARIRPTVAEYMRDRSEDDVFRRDCALLVALFCQSQLETAVLDDQRRILRCALDDSDPVHEHLQRLTLEHARQFGRFRAMFIDALGREPGHRTRRYVLNALSSIDGLTRGEHADDWCQQELAQAGGDRSSPYEAEWAHDVEPNYQIVDFDGETCLALGEGAGGVMHWLKGLDGTVDIGSARFSLGVPRDGRYGLWARVYLDDKCGNSFGIWVDGRQFANFPDHANVTGKWHWLHLMHGNQSSVHLKAGFHPARLEAWEDGVFIDKFALVPEGSTPEELEGLPAVHWDASLRSSLSFSFESQCQCRGTTQFVVVWVRRNSPDLAAGTVELRVPEPFEVVGGERHRVAFAAGNPLCRTSFRVRLSEGVPAGEGVIEAEYTDTSGESVTGQFIMGAQFDWLCSGPVSADDMMCRDLLPRTNVSDEELVGPWARIPRSSYDAYRRLDFERAYGQLRNVYLFLTTDISVTEERDYLLMLTADDTAHVYIDGRPAIAQEEGGPGEGRMVRRRFRMGRGRHRLFVRQYQADFDDPSGTGSARQTWNHCSFKLLIRDGRHVPSPTVEGLPMSFR